jgi:hypothetical protein
LVEFSQWSGVFCGALFVVLGLSGGGYVTWESPATPKVDDMEVHVVAQLICGYPQLQRCPPGQVHHAYCSGSLREVREDPDFGWLLVQKWGSRPGKLVPVLPEVVDDA